MKSKSMSPTAARRWPACAGAAAACRSASRPAIHILAGLNVCIHAITPITGSSAFASSTVRRIASASVRTGFQTMLHRHRRGVGELRGDLPATARPPGASVSSPYRCWLPVRNQTSKSSCGGRCGHQRCAPWPAGGFRSTRRGPCLRPEDGVRADTAGHRRAGSAPASGWPLREPPRTMTASFERSSGILAPMVNGPWLRISAPGTATGSSRWNRTSRRCRRPIESSPMIGEGPRPGSARRTRPPWRGAEHGDVGLAARRPRAA